MARAGAGGSGWGSERRRRGGTEGAPLSGWPSSSAASCSSSFFVAGVERSLPPSASPAASPETRAAELEPGWGEGWSEGWSEGEDGDSAPVRKRSRGAG